MRVECTTVPKGHVYRIYRSDDSFYERMKRLVPLLMATDCEVVVGGPDDDPELVMTVGPLDSITDERFQRRLRR